MKDKTAKARLIDTVTNYMTEEQAQEVNKLINFLAGSRSKGDLMKLSGAHANVDTAMPQEIVNKLQEFNPNFNTYYNVYDYRQKSFGEFTNLAEELIKKYADILGN